MSKITQESLEALLEHNGFTLIEYDWVKNGISLYLGKYIVEIRIKSVMVATLYYGSSTTLSALELYTGKLEPVPEPTLHEKLIADGWVNYTRRYVLIDVARVYSRGDITLYVYFNKNIIYMDKGGITISKQTLSYEYINSCFQYLENSDNYIIGE